MVKTVISFYLITFDGPKEQQFKRGQGQDLIAFRKYNVNCINQVFLPHALLNVANRIEISRTE